MSAKASGEAACPCSLNAAPRQWPLPATATGAAARSPPSTLERLMSMSVRSATSVKRSRPSWIHSRSRRQRGSASGSSSPPPKSQLPPSPLGWVSSQMSGPVARTSFIRRRNASSGHGAMSISTRSAAPMRACSDHDALDRVRPSAETVMVRPRSTSRSPAIRNSRPVAELTARSSGPLNQFQSNRIHSTTIARARTDSTIPCRREGRDGRQRRRPCRRERNVVASMRPVSAAPVQGARMAAPDQAPCMRGPTTWEPTATKWQTLPAITNRCQIACE